MSATIPDTRLAIFLLRRMVRELEDKIPDQLSMAKAGASYAERLKRCDNPVYAETEQRIAALEMAIMAMSGK